MTSEVTLLICRPGFRCRIRGCTLIESDGSIRALFGAFVGFVIALIPTEWVWVDYFGKHAVFEYVIHVALIVSFALLGKWLALRLVSRRRAAHGPV